MKATFRTENGTAQIIYENTSGWKQDGFLSFDQQCKHIAWTTDRTYTIDPTDKENK